MTSRTMRAIATACLAMLVFGCAATSPSGGASPFASFMASLRDPIRFGPPPPGKPATASPAPVEPPTFGEFEPLRPPGGTWGPQAVWHHGILADNCGRTPLGPCMAAAMRATGASPQAMAFAAAFGFQAYLDRFQRFGPVDLGEVTYALRANDLNEPVLLNGDPPIIDVADTAQRIDLRARAGLAGLLAANPLLRVLAVEPRFLGEERLPAGGQRFLFRDEMSWCHACRVVARPVFAYDFAPDGRYLGGTVIRSGIPR